MRYGKNIQRIRLTYNDMGNDCLVTDEFANAGYDIESFQNLDSIIIDRFIEVKSFENKIQFYWSKNELEKAKEIYENTLLLKEAATWKITFNSEAV